MFDTAEKDDTFGAVMEKKRMSWADRMQRRMDIAAAVTDIDSVGEIAAKFGVSLETVRVACRVYAPQKLAKRFNSATARRPRRLAKSA